MKTKPNLSIERLLNVWRDRAYFIEMDRKYCEQDLSATAGVPFDQFENHLISLSSGNTTLSNDDTFWSESWKDSTDNDRRYQGGVAFALERWAANSRRIFHIEDDLRLLLDATSLEEVCLGDVGFPFDAFAIETQTPFIGATGSLINTCIFAIERDEGHCIIHIFGIKKRTENYTPLPIQIKSDIARALSQNNWSRLANSLRKSERHTALIPVETFHTRKWSLNTTIDKALEEMRADLGSDSAQILMGGETRPIDVIDTFASLLRTTFGMCLYLKSLPTGAPQVSPWEKVQERNGARPRATDGTLVCRVESTFKLSPDERKVFTASAKEISRSFGEKCCHFRRGTWCRPSNSPPDAPRSIWRRPTIVRADKLQPGEVPKGARTILLTSKT